MAGEAFLRDTGPCAACPGRQLVGCVLGVG